MKNGPFIFDDINNIILSYVSKYISDIRLVSKHWKIITDKFINDQIKNKKFIVTINISDYASFNKIMAVNNSNPIMLCNIIFFSKYLNENEIITFLCNHIMLKLINTVYAKKYENLKRDNCIIHKQIQHNNKQQMLTPKKINDDNIYSKICIAKNKEYCEFLQKEINRNQKLIDNNFNLISVDKQNNVHYGIFMLVSMLCELEFLNFRNVKDEKGIIYANDLYKFINCSIYHYDHMKILQAINGKVPDYLIELYKVKINKNITKIINEPSYTIF